jgi:hypothetical protein
MTAGLDKFEKMTQSALDRIADNSTKALDCYEEINKNNNKRLKKKGQSFINGFLKESQQEINDELLRGVEAIISVRHPAPVDADIPAQASPSTST